MSDKTYLYFNNDYVHRALTCADNQSLLSMAELVNLISLSDCSILLIKHDQMRHTHAVHLLQHAKKMNVKADVINIEQ